MVLHAYRNTFDLAYENVTVWFMGLGVTTCYCGKHWQPCVMLPE